MTIYICDDSKIDLMHLSHHLNDFISHINLSIEILSFSSGESLLKAYKESISKPALIFLDIYMAGMDGMSTAVALRNEGCKSGIIFTTSSMEHAMQSYNVDALYYLQKPYTHDDFLNAIQKCYTIFKDAAKTFSFSVQGKKRSYALKDILFFETGKHSTIIHTVTEVLSFKSSLSDVCTAFEDNKDFVKIGQSFLVNKLYIKGVTNNDIYMADSTMIQIPVRLKKNLMDELSNP